MIILERYRALGQVMATQGEDLEVSILASIVALESLLEEYTEQRVMDYIKSLGVVRNNVGTLSGLNVDITEFLNANGYGVEGTPDSFYLVKL